MKTIDTMTLPELEKHRTKVQRVLAEEETNLLQQPVSTTRIFRLYVVEAHKRALACIDVRIAKRQKEAA